MSQKKNRRNVNRKTSIEKKVSNNPQKKDKIETADVGDREKKGKDPFSFLERFSICSEVLAFLGIVFFLISCIIVFSCLCRVAYGRDVKSALMIQTWFDSGFHRIEQVFLDYRIEFFLTQVSVTFITVTILSIFSDKPKKIYWQNVVEKTIKTPPIANFKSITEISLILLAINLVVLFLSGRAWILFAFIFVANIFWLGTLTIKMVEIYFDEEWKAIDLEMSFVELDPNSDRRKRRLVRRMDRWLGVGLEKDDSESIQYKGYLHELMINTKEAYASGEMEEFSRNISFYFKYFWKIDERELNKTMIFLREDPALYYIYEKNIGNILDSLTFDNSYYRECFNSSEIKRFNRNQYVNIVKKYMCVYGKTDKDLVYRRFRNMASFLRELVGFIPTETKNEELSTESEDEAIYSIIEEFCACYKYLFESKKDSNEFKTVERNGIIHIVGIENVKRNIMDDLNDFIDNEGSYGSFDSALISPEEIKAIKLRNKTTIDLRISGFFAFASIVVFAIVIRFTKMEPYKEIWDYSDEVKEQINMPEIHAGVIIPPKEFFQADVLITDGSSENGYSKHGEYYYVEALIDGKETVYLCSHKVSKLVSGSKIRIKGKTRQDLVTHYSKNADINQGAIVWVYDTFELPYQYTFKP